MANYDRSVPWKMMQQRHSSGLNNAYFSTGFNPVTSASGERRIAHCGNDSAYYGDERGAAAASLKRSRSSGKNPATVTKDAKLIDTTAQSSDQFAYAPAPNDSYSASTQRTPVDFGSEWFNQRTPTATNANFPTIDTSNLLPPRPSTSSSLASPTTMFGMENLIADYESGFYSLWSAGPTGVSSYDNENMNTGPPTRSSSRSDGSSSMYMPEDELKMEYAQLADLNDNDFDYMYSPMDTPREPAVERSIATSDGRVKRERPVTVDTKAVATSSSLLLGSPVLLSPLQSSAFRSAPRAIESKRPSSASSTASFPSKRATLPAPPPPAASSKVSSSTAAAASTTTTAAAAPSTTTAAAVAKRPRNRQCDFPGCENRARSHQKCKKHGGAHQCMFEGCEKNSQSRGLCIAHGGGSRCKTEGCTRASQSKGLCKSHGGGEFCAIEGCRKKAHLKHLCRTHGGGVRCKDPKCMKWAQRKGWCMAHAKELLGA